MGTSHNLNHDWSVGRCSSLHIWKNDIAQVQLKHLKDNFKHYSFPYFRAGFKCFATFFKKVKKTKE